MFVTSGVNKEKLDEKLASIRKEHIIEHRKRFKKYMSQHEANFYDLLCQIQDDNSKVIKSDKLEADEYIFYDGTNFRFEDSAFLGSTPEAVTHLFRNELTWSKDANFWIA